MIWLYPITKITRWCGLKVLASPYREYAETNPVQALLYDSMERFGVQVSTFTGRKLANQPWDIWHLHWPEENVVSGASTLRALNKLWKFWIQLKVARFKNTRVFWTVHNL